MKQFTEEKAVEYLNKVLNDWGAFCKTHTHITEAIKTILEENENLKEVIKRQQAEIDRLETENIRNKYPNCVAFEKGRIYTKTLEDYDELIGDISAEAIKEFAERLKGECEWQLGYNISRSKLIDNLVKEMTGKEDENA